VREHFPVLHRLADHAVQGLDGISGVDHLTDIVRIVEQCNQVRPVVLPALTDGRVFLVPDLGKGSHQGITTRRYILGKSSPPPPIA